MKKIMRFFVVLLCFFVCVNAADKANLLVQKSVLSNRMIEGINATIQYRIFNTGSAAATNVHLEDNGYAEPDFLLAAGFTTASWERIPAGGNVTHSFVVTPLHTGRAPEHGGKVTFKDHPKAKNTQTAMAYGLTAVPIFQSSDSHKVSSPHVLEWCIFFVVAAGAIGGPLFLSNQKTLEMDKRKH